MTCFKRNTGRRRKENIQDHLIKSVYISHMQYDRSEKLHSSLGEMEQYICINILTLIRENKGCCGTTSHLTQEMMTES